MIEVSVVILTKDEEVNLPVTLQSVRDFDEVVVVDSNSVDATRELAQRAGARVVEFEWNGRYPKKKQWAVDNSDLKHDWVLLLDADERPTPELVAEIAALPDRLERTHDAYDIPLLYRFAGSSLRHGHRVFKRSLFDRTVVRFPEVPDLDAPGIREVEGHYQPQSRRRPGVLRNVLEHDDRDPVSSWFARHNRYSDWEAHLRVEGEARRVIAGFRSDKGRVFDRLPFKPLTFFLYSFVARRGFLDGRAGFDYAFALSHYYWQIGLKTRELMRGRGDGRRTPPSEPAR